MADPEPDCRWCKAKAPGHKPGCKILLERDLEHAREFLADIGKYQQFLSERAIVHAICLDREAREGNVAAVKEFRQLSIDVNKMLREEASAGKKD
jgi:hypothetical protein